MCYITLSMKVIKAISIINFILSILSVGLFFLPGAYFLSYNQEIINIPFKTLIFGGSINFDNTILYFDTNIWIIVTMQLIFLSGIASLLGINRSGNTIFSLILSILSTVGVSFTLIFINIVNPSFLLNGVYMGLGVILLLILTIIINILNILNLIVKKTMTIKHR